ncbi:hypothetical protein LZC95_21100 [Pendulispora brunnea]|uniref:Uncharacterized protein n=1 Tax=Pendulispora brunnea TaxID=2905690 RepID=A0ABZ2KQI3_9BACT
MKTSRARTFRGGIALGLLSCAFVAACSTLLGVDDLPPRSPTADGGPDARRDGDSGNLGAAGTLDPTFGRQGIGTLSMPFPSRFVAVIADGDDLLLLVATEQPSLHVFRCTGDGVCDAAHPATLFSEQGSGTQLVATAELAPAGDGLLVYFKAITPEVPGTSTNVAKVARDGGVRVLVQQTSTSIALPQGAITASPSRIVTVDPTIDSNGSTLALHAFLEDGGADPGFGRQGTVSVGTASSAEVAGAVMRADGQIVVAGSQDSARAPLWLRFHADGGLDTAFGEDGGVGGIFVTRTEALWADDAGYLLGATRNDARGLLVRLAANGRLDPSHWDGGIFQFPSFATQELAVAHVNVIASQPDGRILALATAHRTLGNDVAVLARVGPDGLDATFGHNGMTPIAEAPMGPQSLTVQRDGKPVVVWVERDGSVRLARYLVK